MATVEGRVGRAAEENDREGRMHREIWGVVARKGREKGFWTRIGTAFENRDGSWSLRFDYVPMSAETSIQLREPKDREPAADGPLF